MEFVNVKPDKVEVFELMDKSGMFNNVKGQSCIDGKLTNRVTHVKRACLHRNKRCPWKNPRVINGLMRVYSKGVKGEALVKWFKETHKINYSIYTINKIFMDPYFINKFKSFNVNLERSISSKVIELETNDLVINIVNSKDVLRVAVNKMAQLLVKVDETSEEDEHFKHAQIIKMKYGDYPRLMKELRETIRLLNDLEGSGESITLDDIMSKFNRDKDGRIKNKENNENNENSKSEKGYEDKIIEGEAV